MCRTVKGFTVTQSDMDVIRANTPAIDGCPVLARFKAFIVEAGTPATLEHVLCDRSGKPVNLALYDASTASESIPTDEQSVSLKVMEYLGYGCGYPRVWTIDGTMYDAASGTMRATLPTDVTGNPGIYTLSWAYLLNGAVKLINNSILSIERSLFASAYSVNNLTGPPTLNEIRMAIMDSGAADNVLLDDVQFTDDQILLAIFKPIAYFNETNPPLNIRYNTRTFPFREHWTYGIISELHLIAAANYRRNRLAVNAGGMTIDDKNKGSEFLRAAQLYGEMWKKFTLMTKARMNAESAFMDLGSQYY